MPAANAAVKPMTRSAATVAQASTHVSSASSGAEIVAVTPRQAERAVEAFRRFGKGRHAAGLNIGDCFAYALAVESGLPLLFKGDDFGRTDVRAALAG